MNGRPPLGKGFLAFRRTSRVRSCIRPLNAIRHAQASHFESCRHHSVLDIIACHRSDCIWSNGIDRGQNRRAALTCTVLRPHFGQGLERVELDCLHPILHRYLMQPVTPNVEPSHFGGSS
jgi:hypothetical protein